LALRTRYYIIFVAREKDGRLRKIPIPLHYAGVFIAAAVVGAFTITGMAGSYTRMLLKTASFNQVRQQQEALRKDYTQLQREAHEKDIQAASLGSLASEVSALYGLRKSFTARVAATAPIVPGSSDPASAPFTEQAYTQSLDQLAMLRSSALSGGLRTFSAGMAANVPADWVNLAGAPSLWPIMGPITSSFGEREDPFNGEGAFHTGVDISGSFGEPVRAAADGTVEVASMASGYGREIIINHGNGIETLYGHLSGFAVTAGQQVNRGEVIGYVGMTGRSTGPHLHYEVRIHNTPVNPYRYLRETASQLATADADFGLGKGGK
jgi:murein DD-endopeptidase MepM/ murein hydrolase activator NlpD